MGVDQTYEASMKLSAERPAAEVSLEEEVVSKDAFAVVLLPGTVNVVIRDTRKRVERRVVSPCRCSPVEESRWRLSADRTERGLRHHLSGDPNSRHPHRE